MLKTTLSVALLLCLLTLGSAQDYIIADTGTQSATHAKPVTMKTTTTGPTAPKTLNVQFEYKYGAATGAADANRDLITCCVASTTSTDNFAKFLVDKCFATQIDSTATAGTVKHSFATGIKSSATVVLNNIISKEVNVGAHSSGTYTTTAVSLDPVQLVAMGIYTAVHGTTSFNCQHADMAADAGVSEVVAAGTLNIPTGTATTFTVTGTGTTCSTSSTSKSGSILTGFSSVAVLAAVLALMAF